MMFAYPIGQPSADDHFDFAPGEIGEYIEIQILGFHLHRDFGGFTTRIGDPLADFCNLQYIPLLQLVIYIRITEDHRKDAKVDQVLFVDAGKPFGDYNSQPQVPRR